MLVWRGMERASAAANEKKTCVFPAAYLSQYKGTVKSPWLARQLTCIAGMSSEKVIAQRNQRNR